MQKIGRTIKRRRKEGKTDYKARLNLLKSEKGRIVVRITNRYVVVQIVESEIAQDKVIIGVSSKDLLNEGWPKELSGSLKSLPACYLTGLLLSKKSKIREAIADFGLQRNIHKGRLYAVLKGAIDGGMDIKCDEKILPDEEMMNKNEKLNEIVEKVKGGIK